MNNNVSPKRTNNSKSLSCIFLAVDAPIELHTLTQLKNSSIKRKKKRREKALASKDYSVWIGYLFYPFSSSLFSFFFFLLFFIFLFFFTIFFFSFLRSALRLNKVEFLFFSFFFPF